MTMVRKLSTLYFLLIFPVWGFGGETREPEHARTKVINKVFDKKFAPALKVATFNIAAGRVSDVSSVAKALVALDADIVALQEVDLNTGRSGGINQPAKLTELSGFNVVFGKAIDFEGGDYGLAIASRYPIKGVEVRALESGDREGRIVMMAEVVVPSFEYPITVFNTHLDPSDNPELRLKQARQLNKWTMNYRGIKLLLGDINDVPVSGTYQELQRFWIDTWRDMPDRRTWPAANPEISVDYVFTSPAQRWEVKPVELSVLEAGLSWPDITDHLPVVVDMILLEQ